MSIDYSAVLVLELYTLYAFESSKYHKKIPFWALASNFFRSALLFKM